MMLQGGYFNCVASFRRRSIRLAANARLLEALPASS
jgi:hypothetical protein